MNPSRGDDSGRGFWFVAVAVAVAGGGRAADQANIIIWTAGLSS